MLEAYVPPVITEAEPVFIRHAGEVLHDEVRACLVQLLSVRLQNDLNHVQFMHGYGLAPYGDENYPEENRALMLEWEKQTRRMRRVADELTTLGADAQAIISEANYWLEKGKFKTRLFKTSIESWADMGVWRWLRARAHCYRAMTEFGSIYVPLSDIAFQTYFDLGLARWPESATDAPVLRVRALMRKGDREAVLKAFRKWYPMCIEYMTQNSEIEERCLDLRLCTRGLTMMRPAFERAIRGDLINIGLRVEA